MTPRFDSFLPSCANRDRSFPGRTENELSPDSRRVLQSDAMSLTFGQMPELQAQRAVEILERAIGFRTGEIDYSPIAFQIVTKENLAI